MQSFRQKKILLQVAGFSIVALTMIEMFTIPKSYFVLGSIVSTTSMACVAYLLSDQRDKKFRFGAWKMALGIILAIVLYAIFLGGNLAVKNLNLFGISGTNEQTIYGLFSGTPTPLLLLVFALDAIGFESFFRGNLQNIFSKRIGIGAV